MAGSGGTTWRFSSTFWVANVIELFERAAYYGTFIALTVFLTDVVGFTDVGAGYVAAMFAALIYLLPFVTGAIADRIGFRISLVAAFALLASGYALLGLVPTKLPVLAAVGLVAVGGSLVKPLITGTVSLCSDETNRARAFSLFYMMVNIGSFTGKSVAGPVRKALGVGAVPLYSAGAAVVALVLTLAFYRPPDRSAERPRSAAESLRGLWTAVTNLRFLALILITAGFWLIQGQMYASMPKYVLRMVGEAATPEWYANVNPLVVVLLVVPVTHLVRKMRPEASIAIALGIVPVSATIMGLSALVGPAASSGLALHPITIAMVVGIALQGLGECFLSPRYLEYASRQAPAGQEGLYMGYAHLNTFFAWLVGFILSGYLLEAFCPDPATLDAAARALRLEALAGRASMPAAYAHAHRIWFVFASIGAAAFALLLVFLWRTRRDRALAPDRPR